MTNRREKRPINGWINLDKPLELSSTQALGKVKRFLKPKKAGHGGTLDPLATGCLPIALGEATKTVPFIMDREKEYEFEVTWGEERSTDDAEGGTTETSDNRPAQSDIEAILSSFIGDIEQTPPKYSAIKINGQRAYKLARANEDVEIKSRIVNIHDVSIVSHNNDKTSFKVLCGKGTYVRAIARDMGRKLGCFGFISALRRTKVGALTQKSMISLDILENIDHITDLDNVLLPVNAVLDDIPALDLSQAETSLIKNGQRLVFSSRPETQRLIDCGLELPIKTEQTIVLTQNNTPVAIADVFKTEIRPKRLFNM